LERMIEIYFEVKKGRLYEHYTFTCPLTGKPAYFRVIIERKGYYAGSVESGTCPSCGAPMAIYYDGEGSVRRIRHYHAPPAPILSKSDIISYLEEEGFRWTAGAPEDMPGVVDMAKWPELVPRLIFWRQPGGEWEVKGVVVESLRDVDKLLRMIEALGDRPDYTPREARRFLLKHAWGD